MARFFFLLALLLTVLSAYAPKLMSCTVQKMTRPIYTRRLLSPETDRKTLAAINPKDLSPKQ